MKFKSLILAAVLGVAATAANADVISVGSGWHSFDFGGQGSSWSTSFDFTLTETAVLKVTDAYLTGDRFAVYNFGELLGYTALPETIGDYTFDLDVAYADPRWSSGTFVLQAGTYSISGSAILSPHGAGSAGVQLAPVPEPESYALMALGLTALVAARARRARA